MKEVSPFVPFELRPNYETSVEGFLKALYVADFVDKSESLLSAAHDDRAEAALSNFFNRTLRVWRECAWQRATSDEPLALAAERLDLFHVEKIQSSYLESPTFAELGIDPNALWDRLKTIRFPHRVATIHGDLHGDNVRVRGNDAILIDLGSVRGNDKYDGGAPICFDVAMLEVALAFQCSDESPNKGDCENDFHQPKWEREVEKCYEFERILSASRAEYDGHGSWLNGCVQRIRAFGIYEQMDQYEYAIALAIAMWRWCKFSVLEARDRGRRVIALKLGAKIIEEVLRRKSA